MGRPPDPERRRELARRAVEVLEREGLGLSTARLAAALGVKRPTLLYHFPGHSQLVEAALEDLLTEQAVFVLERVNRHTHPIDRLYAQLCAVHAFHHEREGRIVFLTQAIAATAGPRLGEILATGNGVFEPHRRAVVAALRRGIADGTVAPCDPEALVALVRAASDGLMVQRVMTGLDLGPVHALLWEQVLRPLRLPCAHDDPVVGAARASLATERAGLATERAKAPGAAGSARAKPAAAGASRVKVTAPRSAPAKQPARSSRPAQRKREHETC